MTLLFASICILVSERRVFVDSARVSGLTEFQNDSGAGFFNSRKKKTNSNNY